MLILLELVVDTIYITCMEIWRSFHTECTENIHNKKSSGNGVNATIIMISGKARAAIRIRRTVLIGSNGRVPLRHSSAFSNILKNAFHHSLHTPSTIEVEKCWSDATAIHYQLCQRTNQTKSKFRSRLSDVKWHLIISWNFIPKCIISCIYLHSQKNAILIGLFQSNEINGSCQYQWPWINY